MQVAFIAGFFAFFGAVIGQLLSRNTQRETWLLQKRAEAFSKFYIDFEVYETEIFRIDDSGISDSEGMKLKMFAQEKFNASVSIVCLYLSNENKIQFRDSLDKYINYTFNDVSTLNALANEYRNRDVFKSNINSIFENSLVKIKWY